MKGSTNASSGGSKVSFYLNVTVTCTGLSDLSGISVTATPSSSGYAVAQGTTNSSGVAVLTVSQGGTYTVSASRTDCVFTSKTNVTTTELTTNCAISGYTYGQVTVSVTDEKSSGASVTVTASCSGQTSKTKTLVLSSTSQSVTFTGLAAGTWTFSTTYPSAATGADSKTQVVANGGSYNVTLAITYKVVYGYTISMDSNATVAYPQTIFGQTNKAYSVVNASGYTKVTASSGGSWAKVTDELIAGIKRQTGNATSGWTDVSSKTAATAGASGGTDVVTYFPTWYFRMEIADSKYNIAFSKTQIDSNWKDYAGSVGSNRVGHFRMANFLSVNSGSKAYSYGGSTPTASVSLANWETYSQARGTGYDTMNWFQRTYINALLPMLFGTCNLQSVLRGYVDGSSNQNNTALTTNELGMAGSTSGTERMAVFWLHDWWGNMWQWVGGAKTSSSYKFCYQTGYCDNDGTFTTTTSGPSSILSSGYISSVSCTTESGFFPTATSGSSSTYFADYGSVSSDNFGYVGGRYNGADYAGPFYANFNNNVSAASSILGARLAYRL